MGNADLEWESSNAFDVGLEFGLFNNRISGTIEYFDRQSSNLIFAVPLPLSAGITTVTRNIGTIYNRSVEVQVGVEPIRTKNFTWRLDVNATSLQNRITKMPTETPEIIDGTKKLAVGHFPATDVRAKTWVKTPTTTNSVVPTGGLRVAYMNQKFRLPGTPSTSTMGDIPYMRAAEMYLIEAEAQARLGNTAAATTALYNLIITRNPSYVRSTRTGQALLDEILFHRRVELWGEGFRFTDLKRMNLPLNRNGINTNSAVSVLFDVAAGDKQWEFLIPRREINSNAAIEQNPL